MKLCKDRDLPLWIRSHLEKNESLTRQTGSYCLCRGPDQGDLMIQCSECREWYHAVCVKLSEEEVEDIDVYLCPNCDA
ncbi:hypothetical protein FSP39_017870 [Pinctada imbricata]|uniref:PHD-type domain-containing protein n=1 Tax=Pinctada imbricata TaxID=66713 RepID=A0AA88XJ91_PINIB|nr:hypothetical protein FSP39_017870 [Pinctada imbricata]